MKNNKIKEILLFVIIVILIVLIIVVLSVRLFARDDNDNNNLQESYSNIYGLWKKDMSEFYINGELNSMSENISGYSVRIDESFIEFCGIDICDKYVYSIEDNLMIIDDFEDSELIYSYELRDDNTLILTNGDDKSKTVVYYKRNVS